MNTKFVGRTSPPMFFSVTSALMKYKICHCVGWTWYITSVPWCTLTVVSVSLIETELMEWKSFTTLLCFADNSNSPCFHPGQFLLLQILQRNKIRWCQTLLFREIFCFEFQSQTWIVFGACNYFIGRKQNVCFELSLLLACWIWIE